MSKVLEIYQSGGNEPLENLSFEECVLDSAGVILPSLIFYENRDAVVIGKNQNPWLECDPDALEKRGIPLFRRISGGGTVFHCLGNLNIGFIVPRNGFDRAEQLEIVGDALRRFGLIPEITDRGDILCDGLKVSGNAMCYRRDRVLHHITLLYNADLGRLAESLTPADASIETKAIASHRMPVTNLRDIGVNVDHTSLRDSIVHSFNNVYSVGEVRTVHETDPGCLASRRERHVSWEWRFGRTPRFTARTANGYRVVVRKGLVQAVLTDTGKEYPLDRVVPFSPGMSLPASETGRQRTT